MTLNDGRGYYLGTDQPRTEVVRLNPLQIDPEERFDTYFDSREKWPNSYIHPAMDQGECASSWAFSTACEYGSDIEYRKKIPNNGKILMRR